MTPDQEAERLDRLRAAAVQRARVTWHARRVAVVEAWRELRACGACLAGAHVCRAHTRERVRELLDEACRLLSA